MVQPLLDYMMQPLSLLPLYVLVLKCGPLTTHITYLATCKSATRVTLTIVESKLSFMLRSVPAVCTSNVTVILGSLKSLFSVRFNTTPARSFRE